MSGNEFPFSNGVIHSHLAQHFAQHFGINMCTANTVNRTRTDREYIDEMLTRFPAEIETMESAALHYVEANNAVATYWRTHVQGP